VANDQTTLLFSIVDMPPVIALVTAAPWDGKPAIAPLGASSRYEGLGWVITYYPGSGKLVVQGAQSKALVQAIVSHGELDREAFLYRASVMLQTAVPNVLTDVRVVREDDNWWLQITNLDGETVRVKEE
jgi:hypothetical protein